MSSSFKLLTDTYRCLISGSCPQHSPGDVAAVLFSSVYGLVSLPAGEVKTEKEKRSTGEVCCVSLTVIDNMNLLLAQGSPGDVTSFFETCLIKLFHDMDVMTQLVHLFQAEDQIVRHLGAKCVSTYVVYHILKSGTVDAVWQQRCVEAFLSPVPGADLDSCLWSLTDVLKRLLKSSQKEVVRNLVASFDPSLHALCSEFLPEGKKPFTSFPKTSNGHWETTFCLLLDLLEALTASGLRCDFSLPSQRLVHTLCPALLVVVSGSSRYFVKKKVLLLLKKTVLQKSGEDWTPNIPEYQQLDPDMNTLAQSVLTAVEDNWLQSIEVKSVSFFGGTGHVGGDGGGEADFVMLRAISLLLLKSMEVRVHQAGKTAAATAAPDDATGHYGYLQRLWVFLRRSSVELCSITHLCLWVSLLFGEQDDDMVEAAKALLSVFQHHRRSSGRDDAAEQEAACASSCNPHCHFLFLLQSISFDHSILLDFLISAETCFLDYFVRYLKHLINDWQGFSGACQRVDRSHQPVAPQQSLTHKGETSGAECSFVQNPPLDQSGASRLVDYDSSDESESEDMDVSEVDPTTSACEKLETGEAMIFIKPKQYSSSDCTGSLTESTSPQRRRTLGWRTAVAPQSGLMPGCQTSALACLSELRAVVMRLQTKKLFPYNASSLLKLLAQVHVCSQQSS